MSQKRPHSSLDEPPKADPNIFHSDPIHDRSSTFTAIFSPLHPVTHLQSLPQFSTATHRIGAWRKPSTQSTLTPGRPVYTSGYDDDGESYAGRRLENVLKTLDVVGSVMVGRWYGGVLLGPVRFTHIEKCAKEAIEKWKESRGDEEGGAKKQKTEVHDAKRRAALAGTLRQRDESITALRGLLAEKQGREVVESSRAQPIYATMSMVVLEKLEKARDTTIAWLLKELDKAEDEVAIMIASAKEAEAKFEERVQAPIPNQQNDDGDEKRETNVKSERTPEALQPTQQRDDDIITKETTAKSPPAEQASISPALSREGATD